MIQNFLMSFAFACLLMMPSGIRAAQETEGMEQRMQRLLDITQKEPMRGQSLETLHKMPQAEVEDPYRHIHTGAIQYDEPILVLEPGWKAEKSFEDFTTATWMQFHKAGELTTADLYLFHASWPQTHWLIEMELLDAQGGTIDRSIQSLANSGIVLGVPRVGREKISLAFQKSPGQPQPTRYRLTISSIWARKSNPFQLNREIPADLTLDAPRISILRFTIQKRLLGPATAQAHVAYENWPATTCTLTLKLLDDQDKTVAETQKTFANGGFIISRQSLSWADLDLPFPTPPDLAKAVRWEMTLERISPQNYLGESDKPRKNDYD